MGLGHSIQDQAPVINSLYKITLDMSNWDKTNVQIVAPITGALYVYASNDSDQVTGIQQGNASLAINFTPIQATNLATGTATAVITAAGNYSVPVNAQFLRLQENPTTGATITNVYKLLLFHSKSS